MYIALKPAFLATYQLLDEYFDNTRNNNLGMLLSDMNPYLFANSNSADPATYSEWEECAKKINSSGRLTEEEVFQTMTSFLSCNENQYEYQTNSIVADIQEHSYRKRWNQLLEKASKLADD